MGRLGRWVASLTSPTDRLEADELATDRDRFGGTPLAAVCGGDEVTVCGTVRSTNLAPRADVPAYVVELYDGSSALRLVWLGRRTIRGVEPGVYLRARGRITEHRRGVTMFNPAYEIIPDRATQPGR
ncbi:OB-fold nucleic acid binding domain-containing protein [Janibacter massiliensis]|uniref:OB-fold nucleic acid binding domain-containing protein n=1 Tax=Janibacter massiliensis TaxID=2058291 RepID=UPI000D0FBA9A|nr:OB-fold nucleic acid binding domain-containing protein [Janibacter massiliensis]